MPKRWRKGPGKNKRPRKVDGSSAEEDQFGCDLGVVVSVHGAEAAAALHARGAARAEALARHRHAGRRSQDREDRRDKRQRERSAAVDPRAAARRTAAVRIH